jgi:hypothetical protein
MHGPDQIITISIIRKIGPFERGNMRILASKLSDLRGNQRRERSARFSIKSRAKRATLFLLTGPQSDLSCAQNNKLT